MTDGRDDGTQAEWATVRSRDRRDASLIAMVAVYAARHPSEPPKAPAAEQKRTPAVLNDETRNEAAQVMTCAAIQKAVEASLTFDRAFTSMPQDDGTSNLTTAALLNGQLVDVSAVLQWDAERQACELLERM
jgi:hypothetical protein